MSTTKHLDVIIIGAGLSGICAAFHLQEKCPKKSYLVLEGRHTIGGTWDLFKYPGVRSDSDMMTLGYRFRPWLGEQQIADGPAIKQYITDTAAENGIKEKIVFNTKIGKVTWSSDAKKWSVFVKDAEENEPQYTCSFLIGCCGYYNYDKGYSPDFEGLGDFKGDFIHPQQWPEDLDYESKKITVIGSGATAVTLVPALAKGGAAHVTMLQRSPSYFLSLPRVDTSVATLSKFLSEKKAYSIVRWRNILFSKLMYNICQRYPNFAKKRLIKQVTRLLPEGYDVAKHFTPKYSPWNQRLCLVPDNDFFKSIRQQKASVVTDHIERFTETGVLLQSGEELEADIVVSATGLDLQLLGGIELLVDGKKFVPNEHYAYKSGVMVSEIPNFSAIFGYTNASWTLKADLIAEFICRVLNHIDDNGYQVATPIYSGKRDFQPFMQNFSSGYIMRAIEKFPAQGTEDPWLIHQNYTKDIRLLRSGKLEDGSLVFG